MALIHCVECGTQVSDAAASCPKCGYPIDDLEPRRRSRDYRDDYSAPSGLRPGSTLALLYSIMMPVGVIALVGGAILVVNATSYTYSGYYGGGGYGYSYPQRVTNHSQENFGILCCFLGGAAVITAYVLFLVWLYQAWSLVPRRYDGPTPGQAIGFLFIPFFNLYWIFRVIPGLSTTLQQMQEDRRAPRPHGAGYGVGLTASIVMLIPYVGALSFIFMVIWINMANTAVNKLIRIESGSSSSRDDRDDDSRS